jgi:hypothetical protein
MMPSFCQLVPIQPLSVNAQVVCNTMDFSGSQVGANILPSLYYFPNYITEDEEQRIMGEVHASQAKWVQVRTQLADELSRSDSADECIKL